ncbi:MAG: lysoplasmalogenase family protein [Kiritimatiellia bacterium]
MSNLWLLLFTPTLLVITAIAIINGRTSTRSYWLAWCGLAATLSGDFFMSIKNSPMYPDEFMYGLAGYSFAHIFWIIFLRRQATFNIHLAAALLFSFTCFFAARLLPVLNSDMLIYSVVLYTLLSIASISYAYGAHTLPSAWRYGLTLLLFSDIMTAMDNILSVPHITGLTGIMNLSSLILIASAIAQCGNRSKQPARIREIRRSPSIIFRGSAIILMLFLAAMLTYPGETYNPCIKMLSRLGRTEINGNAYPVCHYFFTLSLLISAFVVARFYPALSCFVKETGHRKWFLRGGAFNTAGLITIALVPENVNGFFHNAGCLAAVGGGAIALLTLTPGKTNPRVPRHIRLAWLTWCSILVVIFLGFQTLHHFGVLPFSPYVPTCQKLLILTFALWLEYYALLLFRQTHPQKVSKSADKLVQKAKFGKQKTITRQRYSSHPE